MPKFPQRLLFPADGSQESDVARQAVVDIVAGAPECEVHVLNVVLEVGWPNSMTLGPQQVERMTQEGQEVVDGEVTALQAAGVQAAGTHVALGRAVDEVLRLRDAVDADLIVMGSRGRNAFMRVLLGSDAESVVKHAPCSVLVARSRTNA